MIANYGYMDGSGEFFITINNGRCKTCDDKPCISACIRQILVKVEDDYGDIVIAVKETARGSIRYECAGCKPGGNRLPLPCQTACPFEAILHSW